LKYIANVSEYSSINDDEEKPINDIFIITGINMESFKNFMQDNNMSHISDDRHEKSLKMEVLDSYPQSVEDTK